MIQKLSAALLTALAICFSAPAHPDANSSAHLVVQDAAAYDGTYLVEVGRVWRDVFWIDKDNEHYVPGRVEPLARALVRAQDGRLELVEAIEFEKSGGPVFKEFVGRIENDGVLRFWADVNYLVGEAAPYALTVDFPLSTEITAGEKAHVEPDGFDAAYKAHVSLQKISGVAPQPAMPNDAVVEDDGSRETGPSRRLSTAQLEAVNEALSLVRWNPESRRLRECPADALAPLKNLAASLLEKSSSMQVEECYVRGTVMSLQYRVGRVHPSMGIDLQEQLISVHEGRQGVPFRASHMHTCVDIKDGSIFESKRHEGGYFTCLPFESEDVERAESDQREDVSHEQDLKERAEAAREWLAGQREEQQRLAEEQSQNAELWAQQAERERGEGEARESNLQMRVQAAKERLAERREEQERLAVEQADSERLSEEHEELASGILWADCFLAIDGITRVDRDCFLHASPDSTIMGFDVEGPHNAHLNMNGSGISGWSGGSGGKVTVPIGVLKENADGCWEIEAAKVCFEVYKDRSGPLLEVVRWDAARQEYWRMNGLCRGTPGNDPLVEDWCAIRAKIASLLESRDWCDDPRDERGSYHCKHDNDIAVGKEEELRRLAALVNENNEEALQLGVQHRADPDDRGAAFSYFLPLANRSHPEAQYEVGKLYLSGLGGVSRDENEARKWILRAAEGGSARAREQLGYFYQMGLSVEKNEERAAYWFELAAKQGVGPAAMSEDDIAAQRRADEEAVQAEREFESRASDEREWNLDSDYDGKVATYESGETSISFDCFPNYNFLSFSFITRARIPDTNAPQIAFNFDGELFPWQNSNHGGHTWAGTMEDPYGTGHGLHILNLSFNATKHNAGWWTTLANKFMSSSSVSLSIQGMDYGPFSLKGSARALRNIANLQACQ